MRIRLVGFFGDAYSMEKQKHEIGLLYLSSDVMK